MRILLIEDDLVIATNLSDYLTARGHSVEKAGDGVTGVYRGSTESFDAIVLDLSLPGIDGFNVCQRLRAESASDSLILVLTGRNTLEDKLLAFKSGADGYVVKPFVLQEVEARLHALYRRSTGQVVPKVLVAGDLTLDRHTLCVRFSGRDVKLPPKCLRLLETLMTQPGRVFSRNELEAAVWRERAPTVDSAYERQQIEPTGGALLSNMHILRRALIDAGGYDPIETVARRGYAIRV